MIIFGSGVNVVVINEGNLRRFLQLHAGLKNMQHAKRYWLYWLSYTKEMVASSKLLLTARLRLS